MEIVKLLLNVMLPQPKKETKQNNLMKFQYRVGKNPPCPPPLPSPPLLPSPPSLPSLNQPPTPHPTTPLLPLLPLFPIHHAEHCHLQFKATINVGPSGVRALPLAAGRNEGGHYFGPSGVHALPLAAGRNEGGHYFRCFLLLGVSLFKTTEGVVVGFRNFAWAPH